MNQLDPKDLSTLTQLLRSAFTKPEFARGMAPVFSAGSMSEPDSHRWSRVSFGNLPEFQLFVGTPVRSDEAEEDAQAAGAKRQSAFFGAFAELLGGANPTLDEAKSLPDALRTLQIQGIGADDGLLVAVTDQSAAVLTAHINSPKEQRPEPSRSPIMDALMDVELPVSILLASREASLNDVLQWGPGAIVEFETGLEDPVDVIVNKQVVARGAVVLVDGNYGVRVTEVLAGPQTLGVMA